MSLDEEDPTEKSISPRSFAAWSSANRRSRCLGESFFESLISFQVFDFLKFFFKKTQAEA